MNLSDILCKECISLDLSHQTKSGVVHEMASLAANSGRVSNLDKLVAAISERERIQTTGIGSGMAIPHATTDGIRGIVLAMGVSKQGVEYDSLDNQPVHLIFLLAGEPRLQTSFLSILSKISRFFRKESFRQEVCNAKTPDDVLALIQAREEN
ncbi:MAG: hypothetical protein GC154_21080 [bacterium]|nr:hypothetical protein [bacterium]